MPTSGITNWSLTVLQICTNAAEELGVLGQGRSLTNYELARCIDRLNGMIKSWSVKSNLFRETTGTITIPAGTAAGTLPQGIRDVSGARVVVSATNERPLSPWNRAQYYAFPNRSASGSPSVYYFEKGVPLNTLYVWPVPTVDTDVKIDYSRTAETVTAGTETLDFPQEWQEALFTNLAVRIGPIFGAPRVDPITFGEVKERASALYQQMLDADRPDSYYFETDCA